MITHLTVDFRHWLSLPEFTSDGEKVVEIELPKEQGMNRALKHRHLCLLCTKAADSIAEGISICNF
jgi:hypothetical protein